MTQTPLQPAETTLQSRFQVLLVEDDTNIARLVEANLRKARLGCRIVKTGREALMITRRNEADLVLLDLGLPDMSGLEVCRKIREDSNVPIIMATARNDAQDQMQGLRAGADDYVTKPFDPQILVARVVAQLRRAHRYSTEHTVANAVTNVNAGSSTIAVVPAGWHKCEGCNYIGPRAKFESLNDQFRVEHSCPHCGQLARIN